MSKRHNPERIHLEPAPYGPESRLWCEGGMVLDCSPVWPCPDRADGIPGVEYVRADLHATEISRLTRELEEARAVAGLAESEVAQVEEAIREAGVPRQAQNGAFLTLAGAVRYMVRELEEAREREARLVDALRSLHDVQNGPPLLKYQWDWEEAMRLAQEALAESEPLVETEND